MTTNPTFVNKKTSIIAILVIVAVSAGVVVAVFVTMPVNAFGPRPFWMHGGPSTFGSGPFGYGNSWYHQGTMSGNWTGSISLEAIKADIIKMLRSKVNVSVSDAETAAKKSLGASSEVCCVMLAPVDKYLVYVVHGIDSSNKPHRIIVDAGDAKILDSMEIDMDGSWRMKMSESFGPWGGHGFDRGMWEKHHP